MKGLFIILLIALMFFYSGSAVAATALSDTELAGVSGGGIDVDLEGQNLPQEQQREKNNADYTPSKGQQNTDGMDLAPELFAVLQSNIDAKRERRLLLDGTTQQNAIALNLENVISSDTISTNNIFNGDSISLEDVTSEVEINQLNDLHQNHRTQGSLTSSIAGHQYEKTVLSRSGSESYYYHTYSNIYLQRRSTLLSINSGDNSVQVGRRFTSLEEFAADALPIHILTPPSFKTPRIEVCVARACSWYTGMTFYGLGLDLTNIESGGSSNNDLVLGTEMTLPALDFGRIRVWPFKSASLGKLGGNKVDLNLPPIPGMALQLDELNMGSGFSLAGAGHLTLDPGSITINGGFGLEVTAYAKLVIDLSKTILGKRKYTFVDERFTPIDIDIDVELLNRDMDIDPIDIVMGDLLQSSDETLDEDNDSIEIYNTVDVAESSFNESYEHTILTGGQMTGAEAELLALSEGTLSVENSSTIVLSEGAQQNMRVFNVVNAASSVAANALNISRLPTFTSGSSAMSQTSLQQHNQFNQRR